MSSTLIDQLHSEDMALVQEALDKLKAAGADFTDEEFHEVVEAVAGIFHIDTVDHPEYSPVLAEAQDFLAGLGGKALPYLLECMKDSDMKTDFHLASVLGKMGGAAVGPILETYGKSTHEVQRIFCLYAIGKIKDEKALDAVPALIEALGSSNAELMDTATRAIGKVCENVDAEQFSEQMRSLIFDNLMRMVSDSHAAVRSKAFRSLGKMARHNLLDERKREELSDAIKKSLGENEAHNWDIAYIVRMEAKKTRKHL